MPGLSRFASVSGVGLSSGRAALARVGRAGSFFGLSGDLAITPNMGRVLRRGKRMHAREAMSLLLGAGIFLGIGLGKGLPYRCGNGVKSEARSARHLSPGIAWNPVSGFSPV